jgi:hypothetical protein
VADSAWDKRLAGWFEKRQWRVMAERTGTVTLGEVRISYDRGVFDIDPPGVFISSFGTRARHGVAVIEVDSDGRDIPGTGTGFAESVLRRASESYGTITGLPEKAEA